MPMSRLNASVARRALCAALALAGLGLSAPALAEAKFPTKPVTLYVPFPPGSATDSMMRALGPVMSKSLGQPVVIDNRPGAAGTLAAAMMAQSKQPDGYQLAVAPATLFKVPHMQKVPYDPMKDLTYIVAFASYTYGLVVPGNSPWKTLNDFVADAKARPDQLTYASAGIGGATHVGMEEFALVAGIKLNHIPYKGGAPALVDLLGGQVDALADSSSWAPHVKTGKVRLLATWGAQRTIEFPDVATLREQGFDVVVDAPNGVGAPKGLDPAIAEKLGAAFKTAVQSPEFIEACRRIDAPVMYQDGAAYRQYMEETYRKETTLIERLQLKELLAKG